MFISSTSFYSNLAQSLKPTLSTDGEIREEITAEIKFEYLIFYFIRENVVHQTHTFRIINGRSGPFWGRDDTDTVQVNHLGDEESHHDINYTWNWTFFVRQ